jgi:hypothetical protein
MEGAAAPVKLAARMDMDMDMGTSMFSVVNTDLARRYWYTVAGFVGAFMAVRLANVYKSQRR